MNPNCSCPEGHIDPECPTHGDEAAARQVLDGQAAAFAGQPDGAKGAFDATFAMSPTELGQVAIEAAQRNLEQA